ncbi:hypothetical protein V8C86DRAFT_2926282 [Haematococcus lacustris]
MVVREQPTSRWWWWPVLAPCRVGAALAAALALAIGRLPLCDCHCVPLGQWALALVLAVRHHPTHTHPTNVDLQSGERCNVGQGS